MQKIMNMLLKRDQILTDERVERSGGTNGADVVRVHDDVRPDGHGVAGLRVLPAPRAAAQARLPLLSEARSGLDQRRFSRPNTHFSACFEIYKKIIFSQANSANSSRCSQISCFFFRRLQILNFFQRMNSQHFKMCFKSFWCETMLVWGALAQRHAHKLARFDISQVVVSLQ